MDYFQTTQGFTLRDCKNKKLFLLHISILLLFFLFKRLVWNFFWAPSNCSVCLTVDPALPVWQGQRDDQGQPLFVPHRFCRSGCRGTGNALAPVKGGHGCVEYKMSTPPLHDTSQRVAHAAEVCRQFCP